MNQEAVGSPAISVIVPVYNAEKTIRKCVDSLLAQTFQDFEILLIDDGSPDQCGAICDEYAKQDNRIRVIHQENQGVSAARQCGIDHALGEYSIHADSDDWVEPDMLEDLYEKAKEDNADMVICDNYRNDGNTQIYCREEPTALDHISVLENIVSGRLNGYCWNKLIRLDVYKEYSVVFPYELIVCEDQYVICQMLKCDIKISYLSKAYYHYVTCSDSLSRHYDRKTYMNDLIIRNMFFALMSDTDLCDYTYTKKTSYLFGRAFMFGKDCFSSREFKKEFAECEHTVFMIPRSKAFNFLYWLSFRGYYQMAIRLYKCMFWLKQIVK